MVMCNWNPVDIPLMALPPCKFLSHKKFKCETISPICTNTYIFTYKYITLFFVIGHVLCQFYVAKGELSCQMFQRSIDLGLGAPFNIAFYSLLTIMIAKITGLQPGEFIYSMGDCHIYSNHIDALKQQIEREPKPFPTLFVNKDIKDIEEFTFADFELKNYKHHPTIPMKMAV